MKNVAVIGMGPAGLAVVKELKEVGDISVTGFDRLSKVGGRWSLTGEDTGVYEELYFNISKRGACFSDFPWADNMFSNKDNKAYAGMFPHNTEVAKYLQAYGEENKLLPNIQLQTEVLRIDSEEDGTWTIITKKNGAKETEHHFDTLVVCSGLFAKPKHPLKDFFKPFTGTVKHSAEVKTVKAFKDQRVLVIGSSISGPDMCCALSSHGRCGRVVNSIRHVPYYTHKLSPVSNKPIESVLGIRLPAWLTRFLPYSIANKGFKAAVLGDWPDQPAKGLTSGLEQDPDVGKAGFSLSTDFVDQVKEGKIHVKPGLKAVDGKTVTFQDGSTEVFDAVICATGYEADLSFLPKIVQQKVGHTSAFSGAQSVSLYKHTLVPGMDSIAFAGLLDNAGGHFPMAEMQARYIAATFSVKVPRPSDDGLQAGVDQIEAFRAACPFNQYDSAAAVCESIGDELGLTPSVWKAIRNPTKLLFSPIYPCYYRTNPAVEGNEKAERFSKLFDEYIANPPRPAF